MLTVGELKEALKKVPDYAEIRAIVSLADDEGEFSEERPLNGFDSYDGGSLFKLWA